MLTYSYIAVLKLNRNYRTLLTHRQYHHIESSAAIETTWLQC